MIIHNLVDVLPHKSPFKFVDKISHQDTTLFIANKKTSELNDFFNSLNFKSQYYPLSLLIEHAAQTMFLHGYYIGKKENFWDDSYSPVGLLTGIEHAKYYDTKISYHDNLITETSPIKFNKKYLYIKVKVVIKSERTNKIIFTANINGMFLQHEKRVQEESNQLIGTYSKLQHEHLNFIDNNNKISTFNSTYWFIDGHFPQFPCIPGCFLLQGYVQSLGKKGFIKKIISVKFKNMVTPNNNYIFNTLEIKGDIYVFEIYDSNTMKICVSGSVII